MSAKTSLLTALRDFRPRESKDSLENFITEAFAWLLRNHPRFGRFFLRKVTDGLGIPPIDDAMPLDWITRKHIDGVFPDLVCEMGAAAFIFEHKAWSPLHDNQLANYRERAARKYGEDSYHLVLIVGAIHQVAQAPDHHLFWRDVHAWTSEWEQHKHYEPDFLFADFRLLLESEGLGPPAPISHESILAYRPAKGFEQNVSSLIQRASKHSWTNSLPGELLKVVLPGHRNRVWGDDTWGRVGFYLLGEANEWAPGLSVGFMFETLAYLVEPLDPASPDFGIILDVNTDDFPAYDRLPTYDRMRKDLRAALELEAPEFDFHDHLATHPDPNRWHPIHIRMSMVELFRGTVSGDDQERRFIEKTSCILKIIAKCESFWKFREELARTRLAAIPFSANTTGLPGEPRRADHIETE